jgi:hypothetical protein
MASDAPHDPPFRADHVGSLLRPPELLKARADRAAGKISVEELRAIEDSSIREVVAFQESVGLQSITDGEYRREIFYSDFYFRGLGGGTVAYDPSSIDEVYFIDREGHKLPLLVPRVQARMRWHACSHPRGRLQISACGNQKNAEDHDSIANHHPLPRRPR